MRRGSAPIPTILQHRHGEPAGPLMQMFITYAQGQRADSNHPPAQTCRTPVIRTSGAVQPADAKHKQNASAGKMQHDTPTKRIAKSTGWSFWASRLATALPHTSTPRTRSGPTQQFHIHKHPSATHQERSTGLEIGSMLPPHLRSGARPQAILRKLRGTPRSRKQPRPQHARHAAKDFPKAQRRLPPPGQRQRVSQLPPDVTKKELKIVFTTYGLVTVRTEGQRYDTGGVRTHIQDKSAGAQEHARARERACVFRVQSQRPPPPRQRQHVSQLPPCVTKEELKMVFTTYGRVTVRTEGQRADTNRSHQTATPPARRRTTLPARTMRKRGSSCRCSSRMRRDSAPIGVQRSS